MRNARMGQMAILLAVAGAALATAQTPPSGQLSTATVIENSYETRFQLDLNVSDAVLTPYLPPEWVLNTATQGLAKDANLRVIFVDRVTINGPDGKPVGKGSNRLVYLASPMKQVNKASGLNVQLVIGGLTEDPADAPGPFGNYLLATTHTMHGTTSSPKSDGPIIDTQDWDFAAATGEHLQLHLKYEKGVANRGNPIEVRFYSAKTPSIFQISRQEQVLDLLRNVTANPPDRVKEFSFKGSGGSYAKLFEEKERPLSWDNVLWMSRTVSKP